MTGRQNKATDSGGTITRIFTSVIWAMASVIYPITGNGILGMTQTGQCADLEREVMPGAETAFHPIQNNMNRRVR